MQYAKAAGVETIAVSHSVDKDKMTRDLGAMRPSARERALLQPAAQT